MGFLGALDFAAHSSDGQINEFREGELLRTGRLSERCGAGTARRYSSGPEFIRPATTTLHVALCAQLAEFLALNAIEWIAQFAAWSPITGNLPRRFTFPSESYRALPAVGAAALFATKSERLALRARRSPAKYPAALWKEALTQVGAGWTPPRDDWYGG